jgi:hypothetical protein
MFKLMSDNLTNKTYLVIKYSVFANEGNLDLKIGATLKF